MGNSCSLSNGRGDDTDKFFVGEGLGTRFISRDASSRGRLLDVKVVLPKKVHHHNSGGRRKLATYSCRVCAGGAGVVLSGRPAASEEAPHISSADIAAQYEEATGCRLTRVTVADSRASQLLLVPQPSAQRWWVVPARQPFTRHSGTCIVLGDKLTLGPPQRLRVGDFLRLGSVGLLITETHNGTTHAALTEAQLAELAMDREGFPEELFDGEAVTAYGESLSHGRFLEAVSGADSRGDPATPSTAPPRGSGERRMEGRCGTLLLGDSFNYASGDGTPAPASPRDGDFASGDEGDSDTEGGAPTAPLQCYMCFDGDEGGENPLVAPCECRGSTKYVHVHCLQRWHTSKERHQPCIVSNKKGAQVCGVCKAPYKTHLRLPNGEFVPLLRPQLRPPFISFTVCTRHQHQEELFSTRFHLSFSSLMLRGGAASQRPLVIGRSQSSDMVLDYRTVSTHHAAVSFSGGAFQLQDLRSSNGSFLYVREPLQLRWGDTLRLRWGKGSIVLRSPAPAQSCLPARGSARASTSAAAAAAAATVDTGSTAVAATTASDDDAVDTGLAYDLLLQLAAAMPAAPVPTLEAAPVHGSAAAAAAEAPGLTGAEGGEGALGYVPAAAHVAAREVAAGEGESGGGGSGCLEGPEGAVARPSAVAAEAGGEQGGVAAAPLR